MTVISDQDRHDAVYALRRERFNRILDHHEIGAGEWSGDHLSTGGHDFPIDRLLTEGPQAEYQKPGRWVVIQQSGRGFGSFALNVVDRDAVSDEAAATLTDSWMPVCLYDLDQVPDLDLHSVAGVERIKSYGEWLEVEDIDTRDGRVVVFLVDDPKGRGCRDDDEIEAIDPDGRLPLRYNVSAVETVVAFNSTPEAVSHD